MPNEIFGLEFWLASAHMGHKEAVSQPQFESYSSNLPIAVRASRTSWRVASFPSVYILHGLLTTANTSTSCQPADNGKAQSCLYFLFPLKFDNCNNGNLITENIAVCQSFCSCSSMAETPLPKVEPKICAICAAMAGIADRPCYTILVVRYDMAVAATGAFFWLLIISTAMPSTQGRSSNSLVMVAWKTK